VADLSQFSTQLQALSDQDARLLKNILDTTFLTPGDPNALAFSVATAGLATIDVAYVKQRFRSFLSRIVELSKGAQPPGWHAANGFFRDWMASDSVIASLGAPPTIPLGSEAQALFDVYLGWYQYVVVSVFRGCENVPSSRLADAVLHSVAEIAKFALDLFNTIFGDSEQSRQASQALQQDYEAAVKRLNDAANQPVSGRHMSGWIAKRSADTAFFSLSVLNQKVPLGTPGDLGRIANVVRAMLTQINRLQVDGHNPWLLGSWQLQYQATLQAAIVGLDSVATLALRKQDRPDKPENIGPLLEPNRSSPQTAESAD